MPHTTSITGFWIGVVVSVIAWGAMLYGLSTLRSRYKKTIVIITTFVAGLYYVLQFFLPAKVSLFFGFIRFDNPFDRFLTPIGESVLVIGSFTLLLGITNLTIIHGGNLIHKRKGWYNSVAFFVGLVAMLAAGIWKFAAPQNTFAASFYTTMFSGFYVPLNATMFSVLAFYMATAAYRAFRLRSGEATLLVVAAFLVMLGQIPLGVWLTHWIPVDGPAANLRVESIALWLLGVLNMAGLRAVGFGIGVGALAMSLRLWLNLERGAFFEQEL